jgi:hypothetical protein
MPWAVSGEANETGRKTSSSFFYLANGLFDKPNRLLAIVVVGDVNEAKADRKLMALYKIEDNIHRIIADILPCLVGRSPLPSESQSEISLEAWRSTRTNRSCFAIWTISSSVGRLNLNPQALSAGALSQAEDEIGSVLFDGVEELSSVKSNREDDFFESVLSRETPDNFLSNVILKMAVWTKAIDKDAH